MTDISEGIELFNSREFFASHDYFEDLWNNASQKERLFFQGMVQISVGCYHLICKNYKGALSQYSKGTDKLNKYVPNYNGVDLQKLLYEISFIINDLHSYFEGENETIDLDKIPELEYKPQFAGKEN